MAAQTAHHTLPLELLDTISDGFFILDNELQVLYFNTAAEELLRRKRGEVLAKPLFDAFPEARGSLFEENYTKAIREKLFMEFEVDFGVKPYANWYEVRVHPLENGIAVFFQVTTKRKLAEQALRQERDFSRLVMETAPIAITVVNSQGSITYANTMAQQMMRLSQSEFTTRSYNDPKWRITTLDGDPFPETELPFAIIQRTLRPVHDIQHAVILPDETRLVLSIYGTPLLGETEEFTGAIFAVKDISAQTAMEEALRNSESLYRNLIKFMPHGLEEVAADGRVLFSNEAHHRILGYPKGGIVGKYIWELITDPKEAKDLKAYYKEIIKGELSPTPYTTQYVRPDGVEIDLQVDWDYKRNSAGMVDGFIAIITDVTEHRRAQEMMLLTEKMMSIAGLAAGMAHEINNPLAAILGGLQNLSRRLSFSTPKAQRLVSEHGFDPEALNRLFNAQDIQSIIDSSRDAAVRAARIVSNMLDFSKRRQGAVACCDLKELLENSLELARSDYDMKKLYDFRKIVIEISGLDHPIQLDCNPTEMEQVLLNLFKNAAQAMGDMDQHTHSPRISIQAEVLDGHVLLSVEDNGPGMDKELQRKIFEPFFTTKPPGQGSGLGLAVSYYIITKNHGGEFLVESQPGHGARFIIRLPLATQTNACRTDPLS